MLHFNRKDTLEFWTRRVVEGRIKVLTVVGMLQNAHPLLFFLSLLHINSCLSLSLFVISKFSLNEMGILKMGIKTGSLRYPSP